MAEARCARAQERVELDEMCAGYTWREMLRRLVDASMWVYGPRARWIPS